MEAGRGSLESALRHDAIRPGEQIRAEATKMGAQMVAHLNAEHCTITPLGPEERAMIPAEDQVWRWRIQPLRPANVTLTVHLSTRVIVQGQPTPYFIRTFEERVTIRITPAQRVALFVDANWKWPWTAGLPPSFLWWRSRKQKQATA